MTIGTRLEMERAARFVERAEMDEVRRLLDPAAGLRFLYLTGPGGIGKSEILRAAMRLAARQGYETTWVDGGSRAWTTEELNAALPTTTAGLRLVILDSFESIAHLEAALREDCLPRLPEGTRILAAGRMRLTLAWREDPGWSALARTVAVGVLTDLESTELLRRRGIPEEVARRAAARARGHALTLALISDLLREDARAAASVVDNDEIVVTLVDRLLARMSQGAARTLEVASLLEHLDEQMLARILRVEDAPARMHELDQLSFTRRSPRGLSVHDVVQSIVCTGLARQDPARMASLLCEAARCHLERWTDDLDADQVAIAVRQAAGIMAHASHQPLEPRRRDDLLVVPAWPSAWPAIDTMVLRHEGTESLEALRRWREHGADFFVCRDPAERILGFYSIVSLAGWREETLPDRAAVPLWRRWDRMGVLAAKRAVFVRHWMASDTYQALGAVQSALFLHGLQIMMMPGTAASAQAYGSIDFWRTLERGSSSYYAAELDFTCDSKRYGCMTREFLPGTAASWLRQLLTEYAAVWESPAAHPSPTGERWDRQQFERAVRSALRACDRPDLLAHGDILASRWATRLDSTSPPGLSLRRALLAECDRLFVAARDQPILGVMRRTYFDPTGKQQVIAAELGLSYATYRRYLAQGTRRLVDALWELENLP